MSLRGLAAVGSQQIAQGGYHVLQCLSENVSALVEGVNGSAEDAVDERVLCADESSAPPDLPSLPVQVTQAHPAALRLDGDAPLGVIVVGVEVDRAGQPDPADVQDVSAEGAV